MEVINRKFTKPPNVKAVQTDSLIVAKKSSIPVGKTWYRILQLPSGLLRAAFFAIRIPLVLADTGDDFSNNLFSDLAPVLALFGEQVAKQYLSQSTTFTEDLIFAMAPLGIITAITAAIRVDGTAWMKAAIGRAREGKGQVEIELMSSTSPDVCELWTGDSVVRVLGTPSIFEIYYVESAPGDFSNDEDQVELLSGLDPSGIYDSRTAKAAQIITTDQRTNVQSGNSSKVAPNIALNISGAKISKFEFLVVAATGTALQLGVLVFAGFSVLSSSRNDKFQKNNREVQSYAFPAMVTGTVTLVIGMFICAHIIDRSTAETTWDIKPRPGTKVEVAWLQQGGNVNDQLFDSYLIRRASAPPEIEWPAIISPFLSRKSVVRSWLSTNSRFQIRTSYKDHHRNSGKSSLITVAIPLSVLGFIIQFVGLRGLNWKVAIAQLLAIVLMTCLRAWVRRDLAVHGDNTSAEKIDQGYELETVAQQIKHCKNWSVVTWGFDRDSSYIKENNLGLAVLQARCRLDKLSQWGCKWKTAVDSTTAAIEATMNFLCTSGEVKIKPWSNVFQWKLFVDVVPGTDLYQRPLREAIYLTLSRQWLPDGRGWSQWKADKSRIEAVLSLWMLHYHRKDRNSEERFYRHICSAQNWEKNIYELWVRRDGLDATVNSEGKTADGKTLKILGLPVDILESEREPELMLVVASDAPLEKLCGQVILSELIREVSQELLQSIGGNVGIRGGEKGVKASFGLRNTVLDELVDKIEQTGLATMEDAFAAIIPPLGRKIPDNRASIEVWEEIVAEVRVALRENQFEKAENLLLLLFEDAESSLRFLEGHDRWTEACKVYVHLWSTYKSIDGAQDYAIKCLEAASLFYERLSIFFRKLDSSVDPKKDWYEAEKVARSTMESAIKDEFSGMLDNGNEEVWLSWLSENTYRGHRTLQSNIIGIQDLLWSSLPLTGEQLLRLSIKPDCQLFIIDPPEASPLLDVVDVQGRTPVILASILGHTTKVVQLLRKQYRVSAQDKYKRTSLHYASMRGHTSVVRALINHPESSTIINFRDEDGNSPLDLAMNINDGETVALLIFNGATDPHESAKTLLEHSARFGSLAAVKQMESEADLTFVPIEGRSRLHLSVWRNDFEATRFLFDSGHAVEKDQNFFANNGVFTCKKETDDFMRTALHYAAGKGRAAMVKLLRAYKIDYSAEDTDGLTADHYAARRGHGFSSDNPLPRAVESGDIELIRALIKDGVSVDAKASEKFGHYILSKAADLDSAQIIRILLEEGADPIKDDDPDECSTILHYVARRGSEEVIHELLRCPLVDAQARDAINNRPLHYAASSGQTKAVQLLLNHTEIDAKNTYGQTALTEAAMKGHAEVVEILISRKANVNVKNNLGNTPLHVASEKGNLGMIEVLIKGGADVHMRNSDEDTALHKAAKNGFKSVVDILLNNGANTTVQNNFGNTALTEAAIEGHAEVVEILISSKADVNVKNIAGNTPLHVATFMLVGDRLLNNGANIMVWNNFGNTVIKEGARKSRAEVVEILIKGGADVHMRNSDEDTALHTAANNGFALVVDILLRNGANVTVQNARGETAERCARLYGHEYLAELLSKHNQTQQ